MTRIFDCSVDHGWASPAELLAYVPAAWREYVGEPGTLPGGGGARPVLLTSTFAAPEPAPDGLAFPGTLAPAVPDLAALTRGWLDPQGIDAALLTHGAMRTVAAGVNPRLAAVLVRAANDWTIERWLDADDSGRVRGTLLVPEQVPEDAAAEIRRVGGHPKMAAVLLGGNGLGKPAGHPIWDPIYRAAAEAGLPVVIHAGADAVQDTGTYPTAGGPPSTYAELRALAAQSLMTHFVSLVAQATFDRHPELRVVFAGGGFAWLPSIVWRFDTNYHSLRVESPWVGRLPSEYLEPHVRIAATPFDAPPNGRAFALVARAWPDLAGLLCFASGHPGRHAARPADVLGALPDDWADGVGWGNADAFLFRRGAAVA